MSTEPSGRLYSAVTKYWPKIATGLVVLLGVVEFVLGGLTADSSVEFYLMMWAGTTGGLWFLFETAEKALSEDTRGGLSLWLCRSDSRTMLQAIPDQFAVLFDQVFGARHLTWRCFRRSCAASLFTVGVTVAGLLTWVWNAGDLDLTATVVLTALGLVGVSALYNFLPDYLSLLETRWSLGLLREGRVRTPLVLLADLSLTTFISSMAVAAVYFVSASLASALGEPIEATLIDVILRAVTFDQPTGIVFYSAFFTSVWLWLYAASVLVSRVLLRMNSGVGFLLRATDVERQPFRSMGFVSVIIVSGLFALGLGLVLV